mgnify:CR=1 FL=1
MLPLIRLHATLMTATKNMVIVVSVRSARPVLSVPSAPITVAPVEAVARLNAPAALVLDVAVVALCVVLLWMKPLRLRLSLRQLPPQM